MTPTPLPGDHQLWRELHQDLRGAEVELLPVRALPCRLPDRLQLSWDIEDRGGPP